MGLNLDQKKAVVAEVSEVAAGALSAIGAEYRGLKVDDMTRLRREARKNGVYLRVVRNTLARRAVTGTDLECMANSLSGPLLLAFAREDPGAAARVLSEFARTNDKLVIKVVAVKGKLLTAADEGTGDQPAHVRDEGAGGEAGAHACRAARAAGAHACRRPRPETGRLRGPAGRSHNITSGVRKWPSAKKRSSTPSPT